MKSNRLILKIKKRFKSKKHQVFREEVQNYIEC